MCIYTYSLSTNGTTHIYLYTIQPFLNEQKSKRFFCIRTTWPSLWSKPAGHPWFRRPRFTEVVSSLQTFISVFCYNRQACSDHPGTDALVRITALFLMPARRAVRILHDHLFNGSLLVFKYLDCFQFFHHY